MVAVSKIVAVTLFIYFIIVCVYLYKIMHIYNFLCSDSLLYTSFFFFLLYMVFIHVIVHALLSVSIFRCFVGVSRS